MFIVTVIAVSVDAYVAGLTVGYERAGEPLIVYIAAYSFVLPLLFMTAETGEWLNRAAACILIILGFKGLYGERRKTELFAIARKLGIAEATLLGISLSADSAFGSALFTGEINAFAASAAVFCSQYIMLALGRLTSRLKTGADVFSPIASFVLIFIGASRML